MKKTVVRDRSGSVVKETKEFSEKEHDKNRDTTIIHSLIWATVIIAVFLISYIMTYLGEKLSICGC